MVERVRERWCNEGKQKHRMIIQKVRKKEKMGNNSEVLWNKKESRKCRYFVKEQKEGKAQSKLQRGWWGCKTKSTSKRKEI